MRAVNHGLTGAAIAVVVKQPALAIPLAFASHFVCDAIPHSNTDSPTSKLAFQLLRADAFFSVVVTLFIAALWSQYWWLVILCAFLAASPDLESYYYFIRNPKAIDNPEPLYRFHKWIQRCEMFSVLGFSIEFAWFIVFFGSLVYYGAK
jgi:hypothetical protein